ncbi:hypothetical protein PRBEI_2000007500 [Prionailurus iriomotensis]
MSPDRSSTVLSSPPPASLLLPSFQPHPANLPPELGTKSIEHLMTLEGLQNIKALFQERIEQIEQLFMKIDYESVGRTEWDGFRTYLQLEYSEQADALARQKETTGNREIQLHELSNLEPHCHIGGLEAVPLRLDYCYEDSDKCPILYGDDQVNDEELNYYDPIKAVISSSNHEPTALVIGRTMGTTNVKQKMKG